MRRWISFLALSLALFALASPARADLLTDLKAHWRLNEASGTRVDSHGSNDLTDNNTVTQAAGKIDNAASFDELNSEWLNITDNADLSGGDVDFTLALWVFMDSKPAGDSFAQSKWAGGATREYIIKHDATADEFHFLVFDGSSVKSLPASSFGTPALSTWYFIIVHHDATANEIGIQVNNGTIDTAAHTTGVNDGTAHFTLGATNNGTLGFWDGRLDSPSFWKRVLTAQERTDLYNSGNGFDYPFTSEAAVRSFGVIIYSVFPLGGLW